MIQNKMYVISHCNTLITMTTMFFNKLQWNNSLFLHCTKAIILTILAVIDHLHEHIFSNFSLTTHKFLDLSRFFI